jgi:hypothetical protein
MKQADLLRRQHVAARQHIVGTREREVEATRRFNSQIKQLAGLKRVSVALW